MEGDKENDEEMDNLLIYRFINLEPSFFQINISLQTERLIRKHELDRSFTFPMDLSISLIMRNIKHTFHFFRLFLLIHNVRNIGKFSFKTMRLANRQAAIASHARRSGILGQLVFTEPGQLPRN